MAKSKEDVVYISVIIVWGIGVFGSPIAGLIHGEDVATLIGLSCLALAFLFSFMYIWMVYKKGKR